MAIYSSCKALVIGISRYADPQYDLSYARSDAEALAETLGSEFGFDQVWTLYDADATKQKIVRFFEQDLQETSENDGLVIFFAGHGITVTSAIGDDRGFLVPHDGNPKQPYANISLASLRDDYLPMIPAKHVFLIVDACYSGLALRDVAAAERSRTTDDTVVAELTRRDRKVRQALAAGTKDQKVLDGGLFGHSVFTGRLIEALREADPYATADHVGVHVRERVARDCADRRHQQTPQCGYLLGGGGTFVFLKKVERRQHRLLDRFHEVNHPPGRHEEQSSPRPSISLHLAVQNGDLDEVRRHVQSGSDLNAKDEQGVTPLFTAASRGHEQIVRLLLDSGAVVDCHTQRGTALFAAAASNHIDMMQILLNRGAKVDEPGMQQMTPLMSAASNGHTVATRVLLENGADVGARMAAGWTALHAAAFLGHVEVVTVLLASNADLNAGNEAGITPLHVASREGQIRIVRELLNRGSSVNSVTTEGRLTPLDLAEDNNHPDIVALLRQYGGKRGGPGFLGTLRWIMKQ